MPYTRPKSEFNMQPGPTTAPNQSYVTLPGLSPAETIRFYRGIEAIDARLASANLSETERGMLKAVMDAGIPGAATLSPDMLKTLGSRLGMSPDQVRQLGRTLSAKKRLERIAAEAPYRQTEHGMDIDPLLATVTGGIGAGVQAADSTWILGGAKGGEFESLLNSIETGDAEAAAAAAEADAIENDPITSRIREWIKSNEGPLNPNDQIAQGLSAFGGAQAQRQASGQGIRGGLSGVNTQQGAMNALAPYLQQRQANVLNGLNAMSSRDLGVRNIAMAEAQQANDIAAANYAAQQNQASTTGSIVGGIAGAIPGVLLAPYTGGASLGLIGAGSAIGGGIGASTVGSAPARSGSTYRGGYKPNGGAW